MCHRSRILRKLRKRAKRNLTGVQHFSRLSSLSGGRGARPAEVGSGILKTMWWMVGLIVLAALVLASVLVGFVFRRPIAEAKSAVLAFDDASSQPQRD